MVAPHGDGLAGIGSLVRKPIVGPKPSIELGPPMVWFEDEITRLVEGDRYLLAAGAGTGKSLFLSQLGITLAAREKVAYVLTEEPQATHRARIARMLCERKPGEVARIHRNIFVEDGLSAPELLPEFIASQVVRPGGSLHGTRVLIIDSLMGGGVPPTPGRRWERIIGALKMCQKAGVTCVASCHINKSNAMAGPASLRHAADVLMFMRQLGNHRLFCVTKNRNGIADQRQPARLIIDPATLMLTPAPHADPVAVSARSYVSLVGEVEIQSTITLTFGTRRRIVSGNIPHGEIQQIADMIGDIRGVDVNDTDFSISTRMPGARMYSPTMALALSMTLIGSALQQPVEENLLFVGEIDLKRRIRDLPDLMAAEIGNAIVAGAIGSPVKIVCSPGTASIIAASGGVTCAACRTLDEAVFVAWPQTR